MAARPGYLDLNGGVRTLTSFVAPEGKKVYFSLAGEECKISNIKPDAYIAIDGIIAVQKHLEQQTQVQIILIVKSLQMMTKIIMIKKIKKLKRK